MSNGPRPGVLVLAATVVLVAGAMLAWQDWWTLPFLLFGLLVNALDSHGVGIGSALGVGLAVAGSLLALAAGLIFLVLDAVSLRAACGGPSPCPTGPDGLLVLSLILIGGGLAGLVVSLWWLARTFKTSGAAAASAARDTQ